MSEVAQAQDKVPAGWRVKLGIVLFGLSILLPLLGVPLVAATNLSAASAAALSGAMLGGAEILGILAVAIMGKSGYAYIKNRALGMLRRSQPPVEVSRTRFTIGLVMFFVPITFGWLAPYAAKFIPGYPENEFTFAIAGDLLLLAGLLVLGGEFWDKLRALFVRRAKVIFPQATE